MKMVSVRLDDSEFGVLSRLSEQLGESPHELAVKLGLIGVFNGRADLSETVGVRVRRKLRAESARRQSRSLGRVA